MNSATPSKKAVRSLLNSFNRMICFALAITLGWSVYSEVDEVVPDSELVIKFNANPVFPPSLKAEGLVEGVVKMIVSVDRDGNLLDWIITNATHRNFAKSIENSIKSWIFEAPVKNGIAEGVIVPVEILFSIEGTLVISPNMLSVMKSEFDLGLVKERDVIAEYSIKELDRIPTPFSIERPVVPIELLEDGVKDAIFEFYIDTQGNVHLPVLRNRDVDIDERVLLISQETIRKWTFSSPTVNGRPVVVKVAQKLVFSKDQ